MWKKMIPVAVLASALTISTVTAAPNTAQASTDQIEVHLLGLNDFHGQLQTITKITENGKVREAGGAEYLAAYLKERRQKNPNTLLVDAGDMVGASPPISALLQDEPTVDFLNTMKVDVGGLGNHEFDEGPDELKRLVNGGTHKATGNFGGAKFPVIAANVYDTKTNELLLPPFAIKTVQGVPIGFIGIVTTKAPEAIIPTSIENIRFTDQVEAINKYTKILKRMGVKSIVVLAHTPADTDANGNTTGELADIAQKIDPEVDVIMGGHNHGYANGVVNNKLIVESYSYGSAFSDVSLTIDTKTKDIVAKKADVIRTYRDAIQPDAEIKAMVDGYAAKVAPLVNRVVGKATATVTRVQNESGESALGDLIADAQRSETKADIAFMNPGGIRNDLNAGDITWGGLFAIQPFGNDMKSGTLTGKDVRDILNLQWQPTATRMLQISGISYTWDGTKPVGSRIVDVKLANGEALVDTKLYKVAANAFLASGGDGFVTFRNLKDVKTSVVDLDALVNYVQKQTQPIDVKIDGRIKKL